MNKTVYKIILLTITVGLLMVVHLGCKKSDEAQTYSLQVNLSIGAKGTPKGGAYVFDAPSQVVYEYTAKDRYEDLLVKLDGTEIPASGTINITGTHTLDISATPTPGDYLLSVTLLPGVVGSPETGNFYYNRTEQLPYSYTLEDGYTNLRVQLDGVIVANAGTLTFERAHTLNVFADKYYDIRGTWTLEESYEDDSKFTVTITFTGGTTTGTVVDSDGGSGTFTTSGPKALFTIAYPQVNYSYDGTFSSEEKLYGYCTRQTSSGSYTGAWIATRTTTTSARTPGHSGKDK